jgi:RimJ/RimL family protein N-acetyltransferase
LVNSPGWIKFIGDRNIKTIEDAGKYIRRILSDGLIHYWVVHLQEPQMAIGLITFIKRSYLDHPDIGFAFLPAHAKLGYAFEAAHAVLLELMQSGKHPTILATTVKENDTSVRLLKKLGFSFKKAFRNEDDELYLFSINKDSLPV